MSPIKKLKSGSSIKVFIPAIISFIILALSSIFLGIEIGLKMLGGIIIIYALISLGFYYLQTRSNVYLVSSSYLLAFGFVLFTLQTQHTGNHPIVFPPISRLFLVWMILSWIWLFYMMVTGQTRWKGNHILELAAIGVESSNDAYTERPFPVREIDFTKDEILAMVAYLRKNLICIHYSDGDKIYLIPTNNNAAMGLLVRSGFNVIQDTWIAFDPTGQVSVHISRKTYLSYKENLAFDQLCNNLGNLFIEFLDDYRKGEEVRIIDKLNTVKSDFFA
ncbi:MULTISPECIES: hypothetical protein [unclassified Lentimicrobium]|uniref:hypothetical protein n=1 Tax=unclassified Lentimicrobium TaxID=2677434 RepID=UPI001556E4DC|nr:MULTISPECIES: hypothetical protein [unclassified Lentimicrobium]NPD47470.1 hypothetical protein [Lentimicrobium sp. S6]NPD86856.1 hypothetical protein [Lentimicrobium sp. L6]